MQPIDIINKENLEQLKEDLKGWKNYVPLVLIGYTDFEYFQNCTQEAEIEYRKKRQTQNGDAFLIKDILDWVEKYPQFKYVINWENIE